MRTDRYRARTGGRRHRVTRLAERFSACVHRYGQLSVGWPFTSAPCNFSSPPCTTAGEDLPVFFATENGLKVTFPAPAPELWLARRFVLLRLGNAGHVKVIAKSNTAADMQNDRVVMTASQLHFFSQRILGPTAISECDVSHIHYAKIVTAIVVNSYSLLCQAYARALESLCRRRLRCGCASQCALISGCISLK